MTASTVYAAFRKTAETHGDKPFIVVPSRPGRDWAPAGQHFNYSEVLARVLDHVSAYRAAGYGHGHRVALLLEQRPEFVIHYLALNALGVGIVPINPDYRHDELLYQMTHSEAELAVVLPHRMDDLIRVSCDRIAAGGAPLPVVDGLAAPLQYPSPSHSAPAADLPSQSSEAGLLYTSGTTGRPKGCRLSNFYYLNAGAEYAREGGLCTVREGQERFYNPLPLFHMNHQAVTLTCAILTANALVLTERFSPQRWWGEVVETGATIIHYLGIVAPTLLNQPVSKDDRRHKVRLASAQVSSLTSMTHLNSALAFR